MEICDGDDEDCDGDIDEEGAGGCTDYYPDLDGDTYGDPGDGHCLCAPSAPYTLTDSQDCYDGNADANPTQTLYFDVDRGDGYFDHDCDGAEQQQYTDLFDCPNGQCELVSEGWINGVAGCGVTDDYGTDCYGSGGCTDVTELRTQPCR
jgi:hypothetical protein